MSLAKLSSPDAVLAAMREYDELGREAFLTKYGFDSAKRYYVEHNGKRYESKAIAGVAVGKQFPDLGALTTHDFSGGVGSVGRKLTDLGFKFVDAYTDKGAPSFGELLKEAMRLFAAERKTPFGKKQQLWDAMGAVKDRLLSYEPVGRRAHIHCDWSLGQGNWLKVPWIALFDDRVTMSAQRGTYIVLLVAEDLSRVYVTLNQGATELTNAHGLGIARQMLRDRAAEFRRQIAGLPLEHIQTSGAVDLRTQHKKSKLYEDGTIGFVLHEPIQSLTDEQIEADLEPLLKAYEVITDANDHDVPREPSRSSDGATKVTTPTNLILYGPPGTGKTFSTAARAVQLCDGALPGGGQAAVFGRYKELRSAGRIEFVTFHQSFGYEDFVEGLRPQTDADDGDEEAPSGGFHLRPEPGIFKRIATVAGQSLSRQPSAEGIDLSDRNFYKMSLGRSYDQSEVYQAAIEGGYIALGWGGEHDWSDPKYEKWQAIFDKWREIDPEMKPNRGDVVQTYTLRGEMKPGDIVIVSDGNTKFRAIGEISGPYQYVPGPDFRHRRPVRWLRVFDKSLPVDVILDGKFSMMSLHRLDREKIKLQALRSLLGGEDEADTAKGEPEPYVLIIDEINRANVSKVFGELITLLEPDKRLDCPNELRVTLPYSKEEFGVPANLHVIGTMNTADRSIALLDTALRRRFRFEELMPNAQLLSEASTASGVNLIGLLTALNERIEYLFDREHQIGHAYFMPCKSRNDVDEVMRSKVIPLLAEYFYESWEKVWQVLGEPEAGDEGAFLIRRKLNAPGGSDTLGQDRVRYGVRDEFASDAYDQFS